MSRTNPVFEKERAHAYELPMRSHEEKAKLEKTWKQDPDPHQSKKLDPGPYIRINSGNRVE